MKVLGGINMWDIIIIGAGITGTFIARELSKFDLRILLLDKENDLSNGTTKANSAIVHAGYDAKKGSLKAQLNVKGNAMYDQICEELHVPFKRIGSLVTAFTDDELKTVKTLYERGLENGVPDLHLIDGKEVLSLEKNINPSIKGALYAKTGGIVGPWELALALAENAIDNGVKLKLNQEVTDIQKTVAGFQVRTKDNVYQGDIVINCAGVHADTIDGMVHEKSFEIIPNRGEYNLFDKSVGDLVNTVIFGCPTQAGKGIVILPTVHGNLLLGPTAENLDNKEDTKTTFHGLTTIGEYAKKTLREISFQNVITSFSGVRAKVATEDFIIEEVIDCSGFFNVAAIDSPGLSAAPAIAEYVVQLVTAYCDKNHKALKNKESFNPHRRANINFMELSLQEKQALIKKDPRFGRVICRCENITEGEIVDIIHRSGGATTVDGVKRRARPGSGRCQGGFCGPRVMEILARELGTKIEEIVKDGVGSYILTGKTK